MTTTSLMTRNINSNINSSPIVRCFLSDIRNCIRFSTTTTTSSSASTVSIVQQQSEQNNNNDDNDSRQHVVVNANDNNNSTNNDELKENCIITNVQRLRVMGRIIHISILPQQVQQQYSHNKKVLDVLDNDTTHKYEYNNSTTTGTSTTTTIDNDDSEMFIGLVLDDGTDTVLIRISPFMINQLEQKVITGITTTTTTQQEVQKQQQMEFIENTTSSIRKKLSSSSQHYTTTVIANTTCTSTGISNNEVLPICKSIVSKQSSLSDSASIPTTPLHGILVDCIVRVNIGTTTKLHVPEETSSTHNKDCTIANKKHCNSITTSTGTSSNDEEIDLIAEQICIIDNPNDESVRCIELHLLQQTRIRMKQQQQYQQQQQNRNDDSDSRQQHQQQQATTPKVRSLYTTSNTTTTTTPRTIIGKTVFGSRNNKKINNRSTTGTNPRLLKKSEVTIDNNNVSSIVLPNEFDRKHLRNVISTYDDKSDTTSTTTTALFTMGYPVLVQQQQHQNASTPTANDIYRIILSSYRNERNSTGTTKKQSTAKIVYSGVSAIDLSLGLNITINTVQQLISQLRSNGKIYCSNGKYFPK